MEQWFLEIWGVKNPQANPQKELEVIEILSFIHPEDAWNHVVENNIQHYCVYKAQCVIDAT